MNANGARTQSRTRGRLAPSPTGAQHLGNARTYLLAWLHLRKSGGEVVFRIEDIDSPRVKPWAVQQAMEDLKWLGLDWDEGPDLGGPFQPYVQTQRSSDYQSLLDRLIDEGHVYPCTCTRRDIEEAASAPHESAEGPIYPGNCAGWKLGDSMPPTGSFCWRFRMPSSPCRFTDDVLGEQRIENLQTCLGDFPVTRKNGAAAYQLAVVNDDISMHIDQVTRGNDLIPSTFRQMQIYEVLGVQPPKYSHLPLVVGPDGRRLAKRHGDTRLSYLRQCNTPSEVVVGWALWTVGLLDTWEPVAAIEFVDDFDLRKIETPNTTLATEDYQRLLGG